MRTRFVRSISIIALALTFAGLPGFGVSAAPRPLVHPPGARPTWGGERFHVTSATFQNFGFIPESMVYQGTLGSNCKGDNESPQLSWTRGQDWDGEVGSYAVVMFDETASFTHWGMYNIPPTRRSLPENAGVTGSTFGSQIYNDAGLPAYSGPCPPPGLVPHGNHYYVITVYALDAPLRLPFTPPFVPTSPALFRAMLGHVIDAASITGVFRCTIQSSCS